MNKPTIVYTYRGQVERGAGNSYRWADGYSETGQSGEIYYPWLTWRECLRDARTRGAKAVKQYIKSFSHVGGNDWVAQ